MIIKILLCLIVIGSAVVISILAAGARSEELPLIKKEDIAGEAKKVPLDDLFLEHWKPGDEVAIYRKRVPYATVNMEGKVVIMSPHTSENRYVGRDVATLDDKRSFRRKNMRRTIILTDKGTLQWTKLSPKDVKEIQQERKEREQNHP